MSVLTREELLIEIDNCLGHTDLKEIDFVILQSLKYLLLTQNKTIIKE